jgi:hypothetical protein
VNGKPHGSRPECPQATGGNPCSERVCEGSKSATECVGYVGATGCGDQTCTNGVETSTGTCDGTGTCVPAGSPLTKPCSPYVCGATACKTSCSDDKDCAPNLSCDKTKSECVGGAVCLADGRTLKAQDKTSVCPGHYACKIDHCLEQCAKTSECFDGTVCSATGQCVARPADSDSGGSCGCRAFGSTRGSRRAALFWLALAVAFARRPRKTGRV